MKEEHRIHTQDKKCRVTGCDNLGIPRICKECGKRKRQALCHKHLKRNQQRRKKGLTNFY